MTTAHPPVRIGFVGAGWIAKTALAPAVHAAEGAVLQAVAARDESRARALEPGGRVHAGAGGYATLLDDDDIDAVYISLSNEAHERWTLAALAAGKHVLCEKPLGLDVASVRRMHDAADAAGLLLLEGYFYRWHPRMRRIEHLVGSGELGAVRAVRSQFCFESDPDALPTNYRNDPARGGGALYDVGVYPISAAHALLGPELSVRDAQARLGSSGVDLEAGAELVAPSGARVSMRCAISGAQGQSLEVDGTAATLSTEEGETFTCWHAESTVRVSQSPDGASGPQATTRVERFAPVDPYRLMVEGFAAACRGQGALHVTREDSLAVASSLAGVRERMRS